MFPVGSLNRCIVEESMDGSVFVELNENTFGFENEDPFKTCFYKLFFLN